MGRAIFLQKNTPGVLQVQAAAGRTQQEDLSGAFLQMVNEANQNVKIRNLRRFAWLIEALGGALVGLQ